jgi:hypothetical protein
MVFMIRQLALAAPMALILLFVPAFGQEIEPPANLTNSTQESPRLDAPGDEPLLEQLSEKGTYRVQLRWAQDALDPQGQMQIELVFLNASSPSPTPENFPQQETNATGASNPGASGFTDPGIIETTLQVESYDIAIYDEDGGVLWEKLDQPGQGGRGSQKIGFEGNYTGPVTINITDIRPGWESETATAEDLTDSVSFTATVVPEFPVVAMILAGGVVAGIAAARLKRVM